MSDAKAMRSIMDSITHAHNSTVLESTADGLYYHGSSHKITRFVDEFVGSGTDQFGPGIYMTNDLNAALQYSSETGYIYVADVKMRNLLTEDVPYDRDIVLNMMKATPDEEAFWDFGETPESAYTAAIKVIEQYRGNSLLEALLAVQSDWYRDNAMEFVRELVKLGYDGSVYDQGSGIKFLVVYNPKCITLTEVMPYDKASELSAQVDPKIGGE